MWIKNSLEIAVSLTVFQVLTFFIFRENPRWPPKVEKIEISPLSTGHSCTTLRVKNSLETGLLRFSRYRHFSIFCENPRWPPKVAEIEIFPHLTGDSCTTLWVKNLLEIALSLMTFEIFVIFHIFTKSSNKVAITHLYIEQQL